MGDLEAWPDYTIEVCSGVVLGISTVNERSCIEQEAVKGWSLMPRRWGKW